MVIKLSGKSSRLIHEIADDSILASVIRLSRNMNEKAGMGGGNMQELFLLFERAIESEQNGQQMYKELLQYTDNPVLEEIIRGMYRDEVRHEEELREYYSKLRDTLDVDGTTNNPRKRRQVNSQD